MSELMTDDGVLSHAQVCSFGMQLIDHLRSIHRTNHVLMDVCPDNIIIVPPDCFSSSSSSSSFSFSCSSPSSSSSSSSPSAQLIDFGLVLPFLTCLSASDHPPRLLYASDYLLSPSARVVHPLDDLWSWFWSLYAMLKGTPPGGERSGASWESIRRARSDAVRSLPGSLRCIYSLLLRVSRDTVPIEPTLYQQLQEALKNPAQLDIKQLYLRSLISFCYFLIVCLCL